MSREAPFISKALKLVSLAIILATICIAVTAAYSGYEEYGALTSSLEAGSLSKLALSLNGSNLMLSGLTVPNRMTFPLTLELLGNVSLDNATIGNFDSGNYVIQPNGSATVNVTIPLSFADLLNDSEALQKAAANSTQLSINAMVSAHIVPLLGINITKSVNSTAGPIFGDLTANLNTTGAQLSSNHQTLQMPLALSWQNSSPLAEGTFWYRANLTDIPGKPTGDYGSASGPLNFTQGQNYQTVQLNLPVSDFGKEIPSGAYTIQITLSQSQLSEPFLQFTRSAMV